LINHFLAVADDLSNLK